MLPEIRESFVLKASFPREKAAHAMIGTTALLMPRRALAARTLSFTVFIKQGNNGKNRYGRSRDSGYGADTAHRISEDHTDICDHNTRYRPAYSYHVKKFALGKPFFFGQIPVPSVPEYSSRRQK